MSHIITPSNTSLSRQALQQQAERERIIRLFRGAYVDAQEYEALDVSGQYRVRAEAFLATHPKLKAWGITAAALEGAPILSGAPLHFAGARGDAKTRQGGCFFHEALPDEPSVNSKTARTLFECASSSPLPDALLAANHLLRCATLEAGGSHTASRAIDEKTTEALLWPPAEGERVHARISPDIGKFDTDAPDFLKTYREAHGTGFSSPEAELIWFDFAQLCMIHGARRAIRKTLRAGLYFSDLLESPAESLLLARCIELGYSTPYLQVNIFDPISGKHLGRVDGLWPSEAVLKGLRQRDNKHGRFLQCRQLGDNDSVVIEFDGKLKYQQNYAEALERERQRQNAIGNLGFRFVRVNWDDLMRPDRLKSILKTARVSKLRKR